MGTSLHLLQGAGVGGLWVRVGVTGALDRKLRYFNCATCLSWQDSSSEDLTFGSWYLGPGAVELLTLW